MSEKIPIISIKKIIKLSSKIRDYFDQTNQSQILDRDLIFRLSSDLSEILGCRDEKISSFLFRFLGNTLDPLLVKKITRSLAGNYYRLRKGEYLSLWSETSPSEWCIVKVKKVERRTIVYDNKKELQTVVYLMSFNGASVGLSFREIWSISKENYIARSSGFSKKFPKKDYRELSGFLLLAHIENHPKKPWQIRIKEVRFPASLSKMNRALVQKRNRLDFTCPFSYSHECFHCFRGVQDCSAAVHALSFIKKPCVHCGKEEAIFDPDPEHGSAMFCIECSKQKEIKP